MFDDDFVKQMFAKRLKGLREAAGLSQGELADKLCVSRGSISYYETCQRVPDIVFLERASNFFDVGINFLMGHSENRYPEFEEYGLFLGLSDEAVQKLCESNCGHELSAIIEHNDFDMLLDRVEYFFFPVHSDIDGARSLYGWESSYEYHTFEITRILLGILADLKSDIAADYYKHCADLFQDDDIQKMKYLEREAECRKNALEFKRKQYEEREARVREAMRRECPASAEVPLETLQRRAAVNEYVEKENAANSDTGKGKNRNGGEHGNN